MVMIISRKFKIFSSFQVLILFLVNAFWPTQSFVCLYAWLNTSNMLKHVSKLYLLRFFHRLSNYCHLSIRKISLLTRKLNIEFRKKLVRCYVWSIAGYGSKTWTLRKTGALESSEIWCWGKWRR